MSRCKALEDFFLIKKNKIKILVIVPRWEGIIKGKQKEFWVFQKMKCPTNLLARGEEKLNIAI